MDISVAAIERYIRFQSQNYHVGGTEVTSDHTFKRLLQTKELSFVVS